MTTKTLENMTLADYGLVVDEEVRFRSHLDSGWATGKARQIERDGSIGLIDSYNGGARAIPADRVQRKQPGVRKGFKWVPITKK